MPSKSKPANTQKPAQKTSLITAPDPSRVEQVLKWIVAGNRDAEILAAIATNWPDQKPIPLVNEAMTCLKESSEFEQDVLVGWCFEATKDVYRRMVELGDLVGALRAIKQMHDLARAHGKKDEPDDTVSNATNIQTADKIQETKPAGAKGRKRK